jgi:hypothetical protein
MAHSATSVEKRAGSRTPAAIEAEIVITRERLVGTIAELEERVKPSNLAARGKRRVHDFYTDDRGAVRWERIAMTAGAAAGALVTPRGVVYVPVPKDQLGVIQAAIVA